MKRFRIVLVTAAICGLMFSSLASAQEKLTVWWVKGFYKSEDDALFAAIKKYEDKTGVKVDLSQYAVQDMIPKTVSALDAGTPPDVAYADVYDFQVAGKWAFEGRLEDISDVISPMKAAFAPNTVETAFDSNYHSLQISFRKEFRGAGLIGAAYTYSKNLTDNASDRSNAPQSSYDWHAGEYGPATLDRALDEIFRVPDAGGSWDDAA